VAIHGAYCGRNPRLYDGEVLAAVAESALPAVQAAAPAGVEVCRLPDRLPEAVFVVPGWEDPGIPELLESLPDLHALRVLQTMSAGTDWVEDRVPPWVTLCNARGARDVPMAEWVVGALLGAVTGQLEAATLRRWEDRRPGELHAMTVLVVGHGSIGRAVQERLAPFGARVVGVASRAREGVHGVEELDALLPRADAVVVLLPLTPATRGLFDARMLGRMRDGALLVCAGRGAVVDTDALVAELASGRLRAVLDVTDPEPLRRDHPLWDLALAITPHRAGDSHMADQRAIELAAAQLRRFAHGEPLENVVREGRAADLRARQ
jgi:phosphoglycerate dehydrogenase-like enzyme